MLKKKLLIVSLMMLAGAAVRAQEIAGDWQGILKNGAQNLRIIIHFDKAPDGGWKATAFSIDQGPEPIPVRSVVLQSSNIKLVVDAIRGTYEGKITAEGNSIIGTWSPQGQDPGELNLKRATTETAWPHDASLHRVQFITVEDNVKVEVLDWGGSGRPWFCSRAWGTMLTYLTSSRRNSPACITFTALRAAGTAPPVLRRQATPPTGSEMTCWL